MPPYAGEGEEQEDTLQFGVFVAVLIAFVVIGCLATRAPKKTP
jgi:hypothetical protein